MPTSTGPENMIHQPYKDTSHVADTTAHRPRIFDMSDEEVSVLPDFDSEQRPKQDQAEDIDYAALSKKLAVSPTEDIGPPPVCVSIESEAGTSVLGTLGNVSVAIGKAKSRKTFLVGAIVAAVLNNGKAQVNRIRGHAPTDRNVVLYFDTEQGKYHVQRSIKRICAQIGVVDPPNLKAYGLRSEPTCTRVAFIEWHIYNTPGVFFVVIDGIRDLVFDINSPEEATTTATRLLRWTDEQQVHILTILHQNKGDQNARGHLGTELVNKAETVFSVTKDPDNKAVSIVAAEQCRDMDFEPFSFSIDADSLPYFVEDSGERSTTNARSKAKKQALTADETEQVFSRAFSKDKTLQRGALQTAVQEASDFMGKRLANNRAVEFITRATTDGYLVKEQPTKGNPVYRINPAKKALN